MAKIVLAVLEHCGNVMLEFEDADGEKILDYTVSPAKARQLAAGMVKAAMLAEDKMPEFG